MPKIALYPKARINFAVKRDSELCHNGYLLPGLQSLPLLLRTCPCFWELLLHHCHAVPIQDLSIAPLPWSHLLILGLASDYLFIYSYFCTGTEKVNQFLSSGRINKRHCPISHQSSCKNEHMSGIPAQPFLVRPRGLLDHLP